MTVLDPCNEGRSENVTFAFVPQRIIISVTSDLVTDQRVHRTASALKEAGYQVKVVGRKLRSSAELPGRRYRSHRFSLLTERGPLFYATYNLRLFWYLLWHHADILFSNDLDTLPANFLISRLKRIPLVYDSHEYFTGVPELAHRPLIKRIWKSIEKSMLPRVRHCITVNESIAGLYRNEYGIEMTVIRNVPELRLQTLPSKEALRRELGLPVDKKLLIIQGAGINIDRGAEEAVEMMQYLEDTVLIVAGGGDVIPQLKAMTASLRLSDKVVFIPKQTPAMLQRYTAGADLGLSLDKDTNLNYRFSLPNKLFDYIHAGIPVLASDLPEVSRIVNNYRIGRIATDLRPEALARQVKELLDDNAFRLEVESHLPLAQKDLNWDHERVKLLQLVWKLG